MHLIINEKNLIELLIDLFWFDLNYNVIVIETIFKLNCLSLISTILIISVMFLTEKHNFVHIQLIYLEVILHVSYIAFHLEFKA